jgi:hypothetical protein
MLLAKRAATDVTLDEFIFLSLSLHAKYCLEK